jgi:general secretion pathway protein D
VAANDAGTRRVVKVVASADDRTNTLVVTASPEAMKIIEMVVDNVDKNPVPTQEVFLYPLKNGVAADMAASLNAAFMASGATSGGVARQTTGVTSGATSFGVTGSTGSSGSRYGNGGSTAGLGSVSSNASAARTTGGGSTVSGSLGGGRISTGAGGTIIAPTDLIGQVSFVPDSDTNSLLVTVAKLNYDRVKVIIAQLDRPIPQVLIKVLLAEVTHNNDLDIGVEFSGMDLRSNGKGLQAAGTNFQIASAIAAGNPNGFVFQLNEDYVTAAIRAIASKSKLDVLSRPYILTGDNQPASIMVGDQVPVITSSDVSASSPPTTVNTYQYYNIGIILNVTPHINPVGIVTLDVAPTISAREPADQGVTIQPGVVAPAFTMRSASARVAIHDGQTIVIGGLMQDQATDSMDSVPFLGDIPGLGVLFRHKVTTKQKTELLIFLTPHVAQQPEELKGMSEDEQKGAKISNDTAEKGILQEHLEGMKRGAASRPAASRPADTETPADAVPEDKTDVPSQEQQPSQQQP